MNSLETHVLRIIGENPDSPDVFTDTDSGMAPVRDSINDAIQELCMVTGSYKKTYLLPLYEDRMFYRMGWEQDHFGWVVEAWDRSRGMRLEQTNVLTLAMTDGFWMERTGNPEEYMQIGENILGVFYKPSANGIVLELTCACIPKAYAADTDPIKVREVFQNAAAYLAVSEFYASRGNASRATEYLNLYLETAGLMSMHPEAAERVYQTGGQQNWQPSPKN